MLPDASPCQTPRELSSPSPQLMVPSLLTRTFLSRRPAPLSPPRQPVPPPARRGLVVLLLVPTTPATEARGQSRAAQFESHGQTRRWVWHQGQRLFKPRFDLPANRTTHHAPAARISEMLRSQIEHTSPAGAAAHTEPERVCCSGRARTFAPSGATAEATHGVDYRHRRWRESDGRSLRWVMVY